MNEQPFNCAYLHDRITNEEIHDHPDLNFIINEKFTIVAKMNMDLFIGSNAVLKRLKCLKIKLMLVVFIFCGFPDALTHSVQSYNFKKKMSPSTEFIFPRQEPIWDTP